MQSAYIAEAFGTCLLVFLGNGAVATHVLKKSKGRKGGWSAITWGWGLAVMVAIYAIARFSQAHINPAVTLALAANDLFPWSDVAGYITGQCIGALIGSFLVYLIYYPHFEVTKDSGAKLACFATTPAIHKPFFNFLAELLATAVLVIGVLSLAAHGKWLHNPAIVGAVTNMDNTQALFLHGLKPLLVGLLIVSIGLSLGGPTGYALNPARDFIPRLLHAVLPIPGKGCSHWMYAWVPILGPIAGAYLGVVLFNYLSKLMAL